ncbi:hypothetical protein M9Y10_003522 [Tritrichomonas musculus]|uniref:Uncharacterized protein n=1 Tax=Tritrichomonas musculus TaxID=1915356 RepID=A0ABR2JQC2_9EUKA
MNEEPNQAKETFNLLEVNECDDNENIDFPISSDNNIKIPFLQLLKYSRIVQQEYPKNEIIDRLSSQLQHFQRTCNIKSENISTFFKLLKDEQIEVSSDQFCDLCTLSEIFKVDSLQKLLDRYLEKHSQNIDLIIHLLIDQISSENSELFIQNRFSANMEKYLNDNVDKCIEDENFGKLPASVINRIFEKSDIQKISSDMLYDFIVKCINERFVLFKFLDIRKLSDQNFNDMYLNYSKLNESNLIKYYDYLRIDLKYIKLLKDDVHKSKNQIEMLNEKNTQYQKEQYQFKDQINQMQNHINELEMLKSQLQMQINKLTNENEKYKNINQQIKEEKKQLESQISKLENENNEIKTQKDQFEIQANKLMKENNELKAQKQKIEQEKNQVEIQTNETKKECDEKIKKNQSQYMEQINELTSKNEQLAEKLEEFKKMNNENNENKMKKYFDIIKELISHVSDIGKISISGIYLMFKEQSYIMHVK